MIGVPKGSRTPVVAVKGRCPRPLDDGDESGFRKNPVTTSDRTFFKRIGGARRDRTADLNTASVALSRLSYGPSIQN